MDFSHSFESRSKSQHDLSNVSAPELMVVFVASLTNMRVSHKLELTINDLMESQDS